MVFTRHPFCPWRMFTKHFHRSVLKEEFLHLGSQLNSVWVFCLLCGLSLMILFSAACSGLDDIWDENIKTETGRQQTYLSTAEPAGGPITLELAETQIRSLQ